LMTGFFPAQTGVKYTLEKNMPDDEYPQVPLPLPDQFKNIATVMTAAGYNVVYKGKWHLVKPPGKRKLYIPHDVGQYGFARWNPQDAGENQDIIYEGGGFIDNDGRFMNDDGPWPAGKEGVLAYLDSVATSQQPFCLIVSLVNPHDVLFYPNTYLKGGYIDPSWLEGDIEPPATAHEDLSTKPVVQREFLALSKVALGNIASPEMMRAYLNFYGNLMKSSDNYLVQVLDKLDQLGLRDNTLVIKTADHGEMGMAHGGQRQKNFNFYEESIKVPLIYSNPRLFNGPCTSSALVSHVDFLPTLANLFDAPMTARSRWQGIDYSRLVLDPSAPPVQDYIVFTYDDYQSGQPTPPYPTPPNHIQSIREKRYKLAEYYDADGNVPSQWEMYDLVDDPLETRNLAWRSYPRTPHEQAEYERLRAKLEVVRATRLHPCA
ncbi:MAG TPA: sulfatase-like hydrolase/transferase, partial [Candidatus Limnocylindria bacterium]|nr:sulfatase-like hydrolase/transferase [Candidatus Limnocylindria bacterium]